MGVEVIRENWFLIIVFKELNKPYLNYVVQEKLVKPYVTYVPMWFKNYNT